MAFNLILLMIPVLLTIYFYLKYGGEYAIEKSVIPFMILIPFSFRVFISPYMPELTFYVCSILPLFIMGLIFYKPNITISLMDILVIGYLGTCIYAGTESIGNDFALSTLNYEGTETIIPYFVIRIFIDRDKILRFIVTLFNVILITAILAPFEFFINKNLAHIYQIFWRDNGLWYPFVRYGFFRVRSTYSHPIHAGIIFAVTIIIAFMIYKLRVIKNKKKAILIITILLMAMIMTITRAAYVAIIPAIMMFCFALVKSKKLYTIIFTGTMIFGFIVGGVIYDSYLEVAPGEIPDEAKQSAAYRKVLTENYIKIAKEKPYFGYGPRIPVVSGQDSIDNYYLLLALRYGYGPLIIFILLHILSLIKVIIFSSKCSKRESKIIWGVMASIFFYAILNYSVWETAQAKIILFMLFAIVATFTSYRKKQKYWSD